VTKATDAEVEQRLAAIEHAKGSVVHLAPGSYWADVPELPGCFASGDTLDELFESLQEGVALYLADEG
jgi:predicted RNase H-like HicB family nuclease